MQKSEQHSPRVIVISGPPCSGKSALATCLAAKLGTTHLEMDSIRVRLMPTSKHAPQDRRLSYRAMHLAAEQVIRHGHSVILNATYGPIEHRKEFARIASCSGIPVFLIECKVDPDTAVLRFKNPNRRAHPAEDLNPERVRRLARDFQYTRCGLVLDTSSHDIASSLHEIEQYLSSGKPIALDEWTKQRNVGALHTAVESRHRGTRLTPRLRRQAGRTILGVRVCVGVFAFCGLAALLLPPLKLLCHYGGWQFCTEVPQDVLGVATFLLAAAVLAGGIIPLWQFLAPNYRRALRQRAAGRVPRYHPADDPRHPDSELFDLYFQRTKEASRSGYLIPDVPVYFVVPPVSQGFDVIMVETGPRINHRALSRQAADLGLDWFGFVLWRLDERRKEYAWDRWKTRLWNRALRRDRRSLVSWLWDSSVRCTAIDVSGASSGRIVLKTSRCSFADYVCAELSVNLVADGRLPDMRRVFEGDAWEHGSLDLSNVAADAERYSMLVGVTVLVTTGDQYLVLHRRSSAISEGAGGLGATANGFAQRRDRWWFWPLSRAIGSIIGSRRSRVGLRLAALRELEEETGIRGGDLVEDDRPFLGAAYNLLHGRDLNFYLHFETELKHWQVSSRRGAARDAWEIASLVFVPIHCVTPDGTFRSGFEELYPQCNRHLKGALLALARSGRLAKLQQGKPA